MNLDPHNIKQPTLLLDESITKANIARMALRAENAGVTLRPHFKTHQAAAIGEWFREHGTQKITVSSVSMAQYFAQNGWNNINIAFPVNRRQIAEIGELARQIQKLHLVLEDQETAVLLDQQLDTQVTIWIKIDAGSGRTGLNYQSLDAIQQLAQTIVTRRHLVLGGLLSHAGHTYAAPSPQDIREISRINLERLIAIKAHLAANGIPVRISVGDTPGSSLVEQWPGVDEIRPGNYVFYDAKQASLGSCSPKDIAVAVACPVVAKHPDSRRLILYGGAVHLSKDSYPIDGQHYYGRIALLEEDQWRVMPEESQVTALSQEHGIVNAGESLFSQTQIGDLVLVLPAHSCLTVDLYAGYQTLSGDRLEKMRTN